MFAENGCSRDVYQYWYFLRQLSQETQKYCNRRAKMEAENMSAKSSYMGKYKLLLWHSNELWRTCGWLAKTCCARSVLRMNPNYNSQSRHTVRHVVGSWERQSRKQLTAYQINSIWKVFLVDEMELDWNSNQQSEMEGHGVDGGGRSVMLRGFFLTDIRDVDYEFLKNMNPRHRTKKDCNNSIKMRRCSVITSDNTIGSVGRVLSILFFLYSSAPLL